MTGQHHRFALSALLVLLLGFFAVAIYSPLHVHRNHQCSLNDLEHQMADFVVPAIELPVPLGETTAPPIEIALVSPDAPALARTSRGPPAVAASLS